MLALFSKYISAFETSMNGLLALPVGEDWETVPYVVLAEKECMSPYYQLQLQYLNTKQDLYLSQTAVINTGCLVFRLSSEAELKLHFYPCRVKNM